MAFRDELTRAFEALRHPDKTEEYDAAVNWWLRKALPHIKVWELSEGWSTVRPISDVVDEALRLQAERKHLPVPPFITHEMLVDNIGYLQERARTLGEKNAYILVPFNLEWPNARIPEMIWKTHVDATPEEIVAEIYRREAAAKTAANDK